MSKNEQVTEVKNEIKNFPETSKNENMTTKNLWVATKAVLRGKFIAIQSCCKKQEKYQIENLSLLLKQLEKQQQQNKISRRKQS